MKAHRFAVLATMVAAITAIATSGCSATSSEQAGAASPSVTIDFNAIPKNDQVAALLPPTIADKGQLKVAADLSFPPMGFYSDDNQPIGFDIDMGKALGKVLGVEFVTNNLSFDGILGGLTAGRFDVAISGIPDTVEREQIVDFVNYIKSGLGTMTKAGDPHHLSGNADLCGHKVAVQRGTSGEFGANAMNERCTETGEKGLDITTFPQQSDAVQALQSGRADAVVAQSVSLLYIVDTTGSMYEMVNEIGSGVVMGMAVTKNNTALRDALQQALVQIQNDGTYDQILQKWGLTEGALPGAPINGAES